MLKSDVPVEKLGELEVIDENSNRVKLSDIWQDQKTVLVFVRHFG